MILVLCNACERGIPKPTASYAGASPSIGKRFFLFKLDTTSGSWVCTNDVNFCQILNAIVDASKKYGFRFQLHMEDVRCSHTTEGFIYMDGVTYTSGLAKPIIFSAANCSSVMAQLHSP